MDDTNGHPIGVTLTEREMEILRLVADGLTNREIAQELVISLGTVKWYARQIYNKLGVHSRTQAVARAREAGLFDVQTDRPARLPVTPRHNLPAQVTSFVGRDREIAEIKELLGTTRLLTLVGPPGTGKTRLGIQVAAGLIKTFDDGAYLVDLAPISDPELVTSAIAQVLDVTERAGAPLTNTLKNFLRNKHMLLVLDNFEQILDAAPLVSDLLSAAPDLKILATSREALQVYGEQKYRVPPLALPDLGRTDPLRVLSQYEAVELFTQRARAVQPDFTITDDNAPAVAEICVRLDGLPLAIELAAPRVQVMTLQDLVARLEKRFAVLKGGLRDLPPRHQTLRATIDWSYGLLDDGEKTLLARLSVFQGGRTVESAEAVCGPGLSVDVLDGLESLLNKSLLWQEERPAGEPRFFFLETIHEYARERLEQSGQAEDLRRRHAEYFVALVERAETELRGARQSYWFKKLRAERDNLRTAMAWSLDGTEAELGLRLAGPLCHFWYAEGHSAEGRWWTQRALESTMDAPPAHRAKALNGAGHLAFTQGDHEKGKALNDEALALYRELGDKAGSAWALVFLGHQTMGNPDEYEEGISLCEEGLALFCELDDRSGMARAFNTIGELARLGGQDERARAAYEESLALCQETGNKRRASMLMGNLAYLAQHRGDYERAEALARESLSLLWELKSKYTIAIFLAIVAGSVGAQGEQERAARLLGASEALFETMGVSAPGDQPEFEHYVAAVRAQLEPAAFEAAWADGRAMSLEEVVTYAMGEAAD